MNLSLFKDGVSKDLRRKIYGFLSEILHFGLKLKNLNDEGGIFILKDHGNGIQR
jgi:hypothetical protein